EVSADQALRWISDGEVELPVEMILQRHIAGDDSFEIWLAVITVRALTHGRPTARGEVGSQIGGFGLGKHVLIVGVEIARRLGSLPRQIEPRLLRVVDTPVERRAFAIART